MSRDPLNSNQISADHGEVYSPCEFLAPVEFPLVLREREISLWPRRPIGTNEKIAIYLVGVEFDQANETFLRGRANNADES
jgi:hypothetical protein